MFKILNGQGTFPYEHIDSVKGLKYTKELKDEGFNSSLN